MRTGRLTVTLFLLLAPTQGPACADAPVSALQPDRQIQEQIDRAVAAVVNDGDAREQLDRLRDMASGRRDVLLLQLAIYLKGSGSTEESMGGAVLLHGLDFSAEEKLQAVLPHLGTDDPELRRVFTELLGTIDRPGEGEPDFGPYEARIRRDEGEPPAELIRYMYEVSPDAALGAMTRLYGRGAAPAREIQEVQDLVARREASLRWSDEDRSAAQRSLERLVRNPDWWVRAYAAALLAHDAALRTEELTAPLVDDRSAVVRGLAPPGRKHGLQEE